MLHVIPLSCEDEMPPGNSFEDCVEKYLETKDWPVKKILKKRAIHHRRTKVHYLVQWEDTWETRRMYKALKHYKRHGFPVTKIATRIDHDGGLPVKMIKCRWDPNWIPASNVSEDLIDSFEQELQEKRQQEKEQAEKEKQSTDAPLEES